MKLQQVLNNLLKCKSPQELIDEGSNSGTICHIRFAEGAVRIDLASGAFFGAGADNGRILAVVLQQRHQVGFVHGI